MSDELGSLIKETPAPSTIGKIDGPLVLKSKNTAWQNIVKESTNNEAYYHDRKAKINFKSKNAYME